MGGGGGRMRKRGRGNKIRISFGITRRATKVSPGKVLCSDYVYTFIQSLYRCMSDTWSIVQSTTDQNKTVIPEHLGISLVSFQCSQTRYLFGNTNLKINSMPFQVRSQSPSTLL